MVGWHHRLYGHEFERAPGVGDGQGGLACCCPWNHKESDMTERLNRTELKDLQINRTLSLWGVVLYVSLSSLSEQAAFVSSSHNAVGVLHLGVRIAFLKVAGALIRSLRVPIGKIHL